jgi:hypothetical protein
MSDGGDAVESFVQIAPDSTGKKMRNLQMEILQPDGTTSIVQMEVITICDQNGVIIDFDEAEWRMEVLEQLRLQTDLLMQMLGQ